MDERRKTRRGRTYLGALVSFDRPRCTDDCVVRNLSAEGARVLFSGSTLIPDEFDLTLRETGETRRARVVWRNDREAGLSLAPPDAASPAQAARRIRKLESDREALMRRLAQIDEPMA